jgi:hypothetical protein
MDVMSSAGVQQDRGSSPDLTADVSWKMLPLYLVVEILIGVVMFVVIGTAAVGLHLFAGWIKHHGLPGLIVTATIGLEYLLYGVDVILCVIYIIRGAYHHVTVLATARIKQ